MDIIKRILGILFVGLGFYAAYYLVEVLAMPKFATGKPEDLIAAIIYCFLVPIISLSLMTFGYFGVTGEYSDDKK